MLVKTKTGDCVQSLSSWSASIARFVVILVVPSSRADGEKSEPFAAGGGKNFRHEFRLRRWRSDPAPYVGTAAGSRAPAWRQCCVGIRAAPEPMRLLAHNPNEEILEHIVDRTRQSADLCWLETGFLKPQNPAWDRQKSR